MDAAERFASLDRSQVLLDTKRCLHSQDQYSECAACADLCPVEAITTGKPPALNLETCQSCLACLPACPTGAFHSDDDVPDMLTCAVHVEGRSIELICGLHSHAEAGAGPENTGIRIRSCLAGLGSGAYLTLFALGLERLILRTDACDTCKWAKLKGRISRQAEQAKELLGAWNKGDALVCMDRLEVPAERPLWEANNPPLSRRDLFRMMARQGQLAVARAAETEARGPGRQPGRDRLRILSAAGHLPAPAAGARASLERLGFATVEISAACTACGACGRGCPTEALHFQKNEEEMTFTLLFSAQACISCELCKHVCAPAAITICPTPSFEEVFRPEAITLQSGTLIRCERCNTLIAAREGVTRCALCIYRSEHPFGSAFPPGMKVPPRLAGKKGTS